MFNSIKKATDKYTRLLIRMDDITECMNWEQMDKCEDLFDKHKIKPLLGIIPINKDPELLKFPKNIDFWTIFGPPNGAKIYPKSTKNRCRKTSRF